jgi:hypothetical protein
MSTCTNASDQHPLYCPDAPTRVKRAQIAIQQYGGAHDVIVISTLPCYPFCCHQDLMTVSRPRLLQPISDVVSKSLWGSSQGLARTNTPAKGRSQRSQVRSKGARSTSPRWPLLVALVIVAKRGWLARRHLSKSLLKKMRVISQAIGGWSRRGRSTVGGQRPVGSCWISEVEVEFSVLTRLRAVQATLY